MLTRFAPLASTLLAALAAPALAQQTPVELTGPPVAASDFVPVALDTSAGRIVIALDRLHAPVTSANFLHYVDTHRFDGETIYRAMPYGSGGLIQGGVRSSVKKLYPPIAFEGTGTTGLSNTAGTIAMAAAAPGHGPGRLLHHDRRHQAVRRPQRLRRLRPRRRGHGRGQGDPRLAGLARPRAKAR